MNERPRRIRCVVPFCRHTRGDRKNDPLPRDLDGYEWICGEHYRLVDRSIKAVRRRAEKSMAIIERHRFPDPADAGRWLHLRRVCWRAWRKAKRQAIERAMGICSTRGRRGRSRATPGRR